MRSVHLAVLRCEYEDISLLGCDGVYCGRRNNILVACAALFFGVDVKWKKLLGITSQTNIILDPSLPRPPNKNVHIWLECCDQDITDERMVLVVDTCSTLE